ncbi:ABC transporter ATP-binding protein [Oceanibacterium hippocampi]|uniref:Bicarbonate transport ATP-binding protein CmpD n=1 Tax=Oceanibacterium hippocampi TaxID=745714 RepID=A0A1Y5T4M5_9PROT|nr:ABC transporter ATP-binding protein [Oceanibacterium hippocampi]SLN55285.1 Bicarbonate transport ATP-binding protein CmpD [Oceanibacterium hippocampi]
MDLIVEGVSHRYGEVQALDDINLRVADGETLALIGPSGCGKSTLLSIMGGILAPSEGRVAAEGAAPDGCLNPFTYIFQDFALLPWRTVAGNVGLPLEHHRFDGDGRARRIAEALSLTGLGEFADAYPKQLSGGMRQRVGIARAIAVRPALLLLDEPLSALDAQTRELLMEDLIRIWARERTTSVYVTHNLNEAVRLADRVAVLSRRPGRIKEIVSVPVPLDERTERRHADLIETIREQLWRLIVDEAKDADRELESVA